MLGFMLMSSFRPRVQGLGFSWFEGLELKVFMV